MSERGRKTKYRRSTPVGRLRRNVGQSGYHNSLALAKLRSWQPALDRRVDRAIEIASEIAERNAALDGQVATLEEAGFVPPRRWRAYQPEVGHHVRVLDKHRARYRLLFERQLEEDPEMLDDLLVVRVLPSGEVALQRGRRTPFPARKSHLAQVPEAR